MSPSLQRPSTEHPPPGTSTPGPPERRSAPPARRRPVAAARIRTLPFLALPGLVLMFACLAALAFGARHVDPGTTLEALGAFLTGGGDAAAADIDAAAALSRIPRTITAVLVGAALAVSGVALQGATRNPLGDAGLLGLTAGASLAVALGLGIGISAGLAGVMVLAILGTLVAAAVVYTVASAASRLGGGTGGAPGPLSLVLAGAAVTAGCTAVTSALLILSPAVLERFRFWTVGSVARSSLEDAAWLAPVIAVGILMVFVAAPGLDALALGDELAHGLGSRPERLRMVLLGATVLLTAAATALAGPVVFVGLLVPHALRRFRPASTRVLVLGCALWGAVLLVLADLAGRLVVAPQEIHVGVTTVVIGVPVLLLLLRRKAVSL
ncbi:iron ABC transporter permease [Citricoccus sp. K5]|uniref:FecCD family ABC transporter permease n=1 Tax=Citricoccus sp. K5 TaxID=2653135 RepID=UPI0012F30E61|nr:iron ABC transporter permease [Citricoccus sp. K5]VXC00520.1 Iron complex transport system permease protein [Citricoccus sp. K5]